MAKYTCIICSCETWPQGQCVSKTDQGRNVTIESPFCQRAIEHGMHRCGDLIELIVRPNQSSE